MLNRLTAVERYAWLGIIVLGFVLAASALYVVVSGVDETEFHSATGLAWSELASSQPDLSRYVERLDRLAASALFGFGVLITVVAVTGFRRNERWAWFAMWSFPIVLGLFALVFATHDADALASYYGALAAIGTVAVVLPSRRFFRPAEGVRVTG